MLWSYWRCKPDGLRSPGRVTAFASRSDAVESRSPRDRTRKDTHLVCLMLRIDADRVVPEFGIAALGKDWSLRCGRSGSRIVIYGQVPDALWYEDEGTIGRERRRHGR